MKTLDLNSTLTAAKLNESMFKKFGTKINFESYSREDLENYRNLLRTKIHQAEGSANFNELLTNETYQKDKYMVGVLNAKIKEMLGESKLAERKLTGDEKKKKEEIVKAIKRDNPEKRTGKGKSSAYAIATAQAKKTAEGTEMKTNEGKKIDQNKDGKNDWEDVKIARMKASGAMPKDKKVKESFPTVADARKEAEKTKGTGKFDKKTTKSGTEYTRKSSTFDNGTEDKPKEKKVKEALKGGRTKLDVNHNGKLEKDDFAKLRAKKKVKESTVTFRRHVAIVNEGLAQLLAEDEEGKAKAITAASDMVNDFTTWMQRVGQYQTKSMIELADTIRSEFGQEAAEAFKASVAPALAATLDVMTAERESISHAVAVLAGEAQPTDMMGGAPDMSGGADEFAGDEAGMDSMNGDEFGASDAAAGGMETAGREMRMEEARRLAVQRRLAESHSLMRTLAK
jgi:hypothetical protein